MVLNLWFLKSLLNLNSLRNSEDDLYFPKIWNECLKTISKDFPEYNEFLLKNKGLCIHKCSLCEAIIKEAYSSP